MSWVLSIETRRKIFKNISLDAWNSVYSIVLLSFVQFIEMKGLGVASGARVCKYVKIS